MESTLDFGDFQVTTLVQGTNDIKLVYFTRWKSILNKFLQNNDFYNFIHYHEFFHLYKSTVPVLLEPVKLTVVSSQMGFFVRVTIRFTPRISLSFGMNCSFKSKVSLNISWSMHGHSCMLDLPTSESLHISPECAFS